LEISIFLYEEGIIGLAKHRAKCEADTSLVDLQAGASVHYLPAFNFITLESPLALRDPVYKKPGGCYYHYHCGVLRSSAKMGPFPSKKAAIWSNITQNGRNKGMGALRINNPCSTGAFEPISADL
jgi:hypothetical protein